jgi:hypothetical protein
MSAALYVYSRTGLIVFQRLSRALLPGLLAVMAFAASDAMAQTSAKATRVPYQAYLAADCLTGSNFCRFNGEDVPANRRLEIHRVACQGWHINTAPPSFVVMAELRTSEDMFLSRIDFLDTSFTPVSWGGVWAISEQTLMFIPAGHRLRVSLNSGSTGVGSYGCTISGYLDPA